MSTREALARLLWSEIAGSDQRQCDVAESVGITEKHLSQIINGHTGVSLDLADRLFAACGRRLVIATEPVTEVPS
jgi:plasmid maintenance system antidote protein VapI